MMIVKNCNLWTMAELNDVSADILIENGKIAGIGNYNPEDYPGYEVIDAAGQFVMPGIVDPHCHIGIHQSTIGWAGNDTNEITSPVTPDLKGFDAVKACDEAFDTALEGGVTTVCTGPGSANIIGGTFCAMKTYGKTVEDKVFVEELCMKMALGENPKRCYEKSGIQTRMQSAATLRNALNEAKLYKESWEKYNELCKSGEFVKMPQYNSKLESLKRVLEGFPVKIHAHQEEDILTACRISKEFGLKSTIDHCTSGWRIVEKLKEYDKMVILGPTLGEKSKYELKDKSFDAARVMYENGVTFGIMTDHPVTSLAFTRTQCAIFVSHGLPYLEGLRAITINAAKTVFLDDRVGSIEVGKDADIVIYNGDPLHYMTKVQCVIIDGKKVK